MNVFYDKDEIKANLTADQIYELLEEWGGNPTLHDGCIISDTICHNPPGVGSHKLYYYFSSNLFKCYTDCEDSVQDIYQLIIKVMNIQHHQEYDLFKAMMWLVNKFGINGKIVDGTEDTTLQDWKYIEDYERIQDIQIRIPNIILKEYDDSILNNFNYQVKIKPWLDDGISQMAITNAEIGYYPGADQITIPHFDKDGRFIGLRGRTLSEADAQLYGKYRPIFVNNTLYNHPLGLNLYNLNNSRRHIPQYKKAIVFESEKSCLLYQTHFGFESDISVACCGSSLTEYQMQLLIDAGAQEVIIAFDRQFQNVGDKEFQALKRKFNSIYLKYKNYVNLSFILDKHKITSYKASPLDEGEDKFLKLYKSKRIK